MNAGDAMQRLYTRGWLGLPSPAHASDVQPLLTGALCVQYRCPGGPCRVTPPTVSTLVRGLRCTAVMCPNHSRSRLLRHSLGTQTKPSPT
uniref:Uncharacterized protein n=1 Tax=Knipowitschia caucasica TaxID=637954 RepID=A0AAV2KXD9_KNICA